MEGKYTKSETPDHPGSGSMLNGLCKQVGFSNIKTISTCFVERTYILSF